MSSLTLRELAPQDEAAFMEALKAYEGESLHWITFTWKPGMSHGEMLRRLADDKAGRNLPPGFVPHTMLYAFVDGIIVGRVSVRHRLNEKLRVRGGNIGYSVAPAFRRRGYAGEMFKQALPYCRSIGLTRLMISCDDDNEPSWRILERAGAVLEAKFFDEDDKKTARRYWLDL